MRMLASSFVRSFVHSLVRRFICSISIVDRSFVPRFQTDKRSVIRLHFCAQCKVRWFVLNRRLILRYVLFYSPVNLLTAQIPAIVRALHKQLREKSVKTRQVNEQFAIHQNYLPPKKLLTSKKHFFPLSFFNTVRTLIFVAHDLRIKCFRITQPNWIVKSVKLFVLQDLLLDDTVEYFKNAERKIASNWDENVLFRFSLAWYV